jgi:hypothetical protein
MDGMYYTRPPQKPWRVARNYSHFVADKMISEKWWLKDYMKALGRSSVGFGNDLVMRREQRKQQRRLNKYLCRLDTGEWDY